MVYSNRKKIKLNEGEMLADKFWLNPDSKMIWVNENHIKTILENPVLFEYDGKESLDKLLEYFLKINGKCAMNYSSVDNFYEKANDCIEHRKLAIFEHHIYEKGFVWCEYDDKTNILILRSSSYDFLKEGLDDLKEHLNSFKEVHLYIVHHNGHILNNILSTKNEIQFFLEEMIIPRKAKVENLNKNKNNSNIKTASNTYYKKEILGKPKVKFTEKFKNFINKLYA
jgi:hypothetical protein